MVNQFGASADRQAPNPDAILAAQTLLSVDNSTWSQVGARLLELLGHPDLNLRASAAYHIGQFCQKLLCPWDWQDSYLEDIAHYSYQLEGTWKWVFEPGIYEAYQQSVSGMPALESLMQVIQTQEIARPGVAGAWLSAFGLRHITLEMDEWILATLENSPEPEPLLSLVPCNLAFLAHERFSGNPEAIRRLIDMGRADIALAAATDESCKITGLEPLLIELGYMSAPETIRIASWHLAYYYHYWHPRGAELGYVELVQGGAEVDVFLLFSQPRRDDSPYAVVIYPQGTSQVLSLAVAEKWTEQIFPTELRGAPREDLPSTVSRWYQRGYINYQVAEQDPGSNTVEQVIIGYRSEVPWNPKQFLWEASSDLAW